VSSPVEEADVKQLGEEGLLAHPHQLPHLLRLHREGKW